MYKRTSVEGVITNLPSLVIVRGTWQLPILVAAIYVLGAASVGAETILYQSWRIPLIYLLGKKLLNFKNSQIPGQNSASLERSTYHLSIGQPREPVLQNTWSPKRKGGILQSFSSCTHRFLPLRGWNFQDQSQWYHLKKIRISHLCLKLFPCLPLNMSQTSMMRPPSHFIYLNPSLNAQQHIKNQIP